MQINNNIIYPWDSIPIIHNWNDENITNHYVSVETNNDNGIHISLIDAILTVFLFDVIMALILFCKK